MLVIVLLSSPPFFVDLEHSSIFQSVKLEGRGGSKQIFSLNATAWHHIGCKME